MNMNMKYIINIIMASFSFEAKGGHDIMYFIDTFEIS